MVMPYDAYDRYVADGPIEAGNYVTVFPTDPITGYQTVDRYLSPTMFPTISVQKSSEVNFYTEPKAIEDKPGFVRDEICMSWRYNGKLIITDEELARTEMGTMREALQNQLLAITETMAVLQGLPEEPDDDQVVYLRIKFNNASITYTYAAVKNPVLGVWYTTGKRNMQKWPNGCSWETLMLWIQPFEYELWAATNYERLGGEL